MRSANRLDQTFDTRRVPGHLAPEWPKSRGALLRALRFFKENAADRSLSARQGQTGGIARVSLSRKIDEHSDSYVFTNAYTQRLYVMIYIYI